MGAIPLLVVYLTIVPLVAGLVSYPLYLTIQGLGLGEPVFAKLVFRSMEIGAVLALWPILLRLKINGRLSWGFGGDRGQFFRHLGHGLGWGLGSLLVLAVLLLMFGVRVWKPGFPFALEVLPSIALRALLIATVVSLLEEAWLRGALFSAIAHRASAQSAVYLSALLWAMVHFIRPDVSIPAAELDWSSGFIVIAGSFGRFSDIGIIDSLLALLMAGWVLAWLRRQSGSIALCIGVHAGWVLVIQCFRRMTMVDPESRFAVLVGHYDGILGLLALAIFMLMAVWLKRSERIDRAMHD